MPKALATPSDAGLDQAITAAMSGERLSDAALVTPAAPTPEAKPDAPAAKGAGKTSGVDQWLQPDAKAPAIAKPIPPKGGDTKEAAPATPEVPAPREPDKAPGADKEGAEKLVAEGIPDEDGRLAKSFENLTPEQRKNLNKVLTQKFMQASDLGKQLQPYVDTLKRLESDPETTLNELAGQLGMTLVRKDGAAPASAAPPSNPAAATAAVDRIVKAYEGVFGPEVAAALAPGLHQMVTETVREIVGKEVAPLRETQEQILNRAGESEMNSVLESFKARHSDFEELAKDGGPMDRLADVLHPAPGTDPAKYTEMLYLTAKAQTGVTADEVVREITRATQTAEAPPRSVPEARTVPAPTGPIDFETAMNLAKQGIRVP